MKKTLSIIIVAVLLFCFSGCKNQEDVSSDISSITSVSVSSSDESSTVESEDENVSEDSSSKNKVSSSSTVTSHNSSVTTTLKTPVTSSNSSTAQSSQNTSINSSSQSSAVSSQAPTPAPTVTPLQKMIGTWRMVIPENTLSMDCLANMGYRIVYDLTIAEDYEVYLSEKHFLCSETETVGTVEYFDGKRYTLMYDSLRESQGSFAGDISISPENENTAIISLRGQEITTYRYYIEEIHYLTLIDDTHLKWNKAELHSERFNEQYFPWDAATVFTKK